MSNPKGIKTVRSFDGSQLPAPALDLDKSEELDAIVTAETQEEAIDATLIYAFAVTANVRLAFGADPEAEVAAGNIPIPAGTWFPVVKARGDKISVIKESGSDGTVVLIAAAEVLFA